MRRPRLDHNGRPRDSSKGHFNRRGVPKPGLAREEAIGLALRYQHERDLDPVRRDRGPVNAYECDVCGLWHVGTPGKRWRWPPVRFEIGERAWQCLVAEDRSLSAALASKTRRRGREAVSSRRPRRRLTAKVSRMLPPDQVAELEAWVRSQASEGSTDAATG